MSVITQPFVPHMESFSPKPPKTGDPTTMSGIPIRRFYTPEDIGRIDFASDIAAPGQFPYTRGVHADLYRTKVWTMRQFAGFGTARQTNERFKYLLEHGQTGLSTAFDLPTLMGRDSDDPLALGEVGKCGVAISSLEDMKTLFDGIHLRDVSTSMTINAPAAIVLAFYICVAQHQGVALADLRGTLQNDTLKEFHAQNEYVFPPGPSVKLVIDTIEYRTKHMPQWNTVSVSGYHIREAGATAQQELAFTIADGMCYVEESMSRGLDIDAFAPRLSFFWDVHNEFFEEIAKFRAARRMWARLMRDRFAKQERSWWLRCHAQTAGVSLTEQQPLNNVIRVAYQALAAVLGGTQSLHTNSMDETLALPTEQAVKVALRTQQILADETGVTRTVDPLGGSYFVESLTSEMERRAVEIIDHIYDNYGGVLPATEAGYFRRSIADSSHVFGQEFDAGERVMIGVNKHEDDDHPPIPILKIEEWVEREQVARLRDLKRKRDKQRHAAALGKLRDVAIAGDNVMPALIDAAEAQATVGEMMETLKGVYGPYDGGPEM